MSTKLPVYIGWSPEEMEAVCVAEASLRASSGSRVDPHRISRLSLPGVYRRPTEMRATGRWDVISDAPMSTDHAIARFFVPWLREYSGWALFIDGDVIVRRDLIELIEQRDDRYAVMVVQHPTLPARGEKKAGEVQVPYRRKNWSSVMLFNCSHPANRRLTLDYLNGVPGRDLHAFNWIDDEEIGPLHPRWNYLVGIYPPMVDPAIVHYTLGVPTIPGHEHDHYAEEWYFWARVAGYRLRQPARQVEPLDAAG